jgi:hypothetical protein
MAENNYRQSFKAAIARIYNTSGAIVGAGFLVSDRHLLTCAHVVTAALGIATETVEMPTAFLELDFPLIAPGQKVPAKVVFWQPVNPSQIGEDIAGLVLAAPISAMSKPVRLMMTEEFWNHPFQVFGFPSKRDEGIWASGVLRDRLANGWVQMEDIKAQGYAVQPGFSGAPVWDESLQGVVGMAVAAEKKREDAKAAFMIPVSMLAQVWTELGQSVQLSDAPETDLESQSMKDFFISYNRADKQWAEWIAWTLEEAGYSVVIQAWDFRPGGNFVLDMQRAAAESEKTIAVLSESYLKASYTQPEWAAAFASDPESLERKLIPVRVKECKPEGLLRPIVYVDLVGKSKAEAKQAVLAALQPRVKPEQEPGFPGTIAVEQKTEEPVFPDSTDVAMNPGLSKSQQIKCKARQERLKSLTTDYKAASKQFEYALSEVDRTRLKRQLAALEEELDQAESEFKALGC